MWSIRGPAIRSLHRSVPGGPSALDEAPSLEGPAEGDLVVAGTRGYVYAPAPWWKMDYFEIRKEDPRDNRRYFYQFEGDGIRDELADFVRRIRNEARESIVTEELTRKIAEIIEIFRGGAGVHTI